MYMCVAYNPKLREFPTQSFGSQYIYTCTFTSMLKSNPKRLVQAVHPIRNGPQDKFRGSDMVLVSTITKLDDGG